LLSHTDAGGRAPRRVEVLIKEIRIEVRTGKKSFMILTGKKFVLYAAQKKMTVITARYPPSTIPVVKISASFQLSGRVEGFTRSFDMVIMVPVDTRKWLGRK
jgi:hypothetical protein